jgi:hypothetical protein
VFLLARLSHVSCAGIPFPVLRKHAEGHVTCLGAYVVVDLLERWTGDKSVQRSVLVKSDADAAHSPEESEGVDLKAAARRGVRFYHAVLQRVGDWHKNMATEGAAGGSRPSNGRGTKRKRLH